MTDQIHLRLGARPWRPTDKARPGKVLNFYDIPLAGILRQHGRFFLFECLEGETQNASLWAYVPISRRDARRLAQLTGDRLVDAMHAAYKQRSIMVAVALDSRIEFGECVNVRTEETYRADVKTAVKAKAARDSSAVDGLLAGV